MTVQALNNHPLNQAALRRLRQEGLPHHPDRLAHVLQLADLGLEGEDHQPAEDSDPRRKAVQDWEASPRLQQSALLVLQDQVDPQQVLSQPLPLLSDHLAACLRQPRDPQSV